MTDLAQQGSRWTTGPKLSVSLYARAMLLIGASLAIVTAISVFVSIEQRRASLTENLHDRLRQASVQQAVAVSDLLWKLNREGARIVLQGIAHDPDFLAVRLLDDKGRVFASVGPADLDTPLAEKSEAPVLLQDGSGIRQIGTLLLYFSRARLEAMLREALWEAWQIGLLQLAAVLLATGLVLRALLKPLEAITGRMLTVADGDAASPVPFKDRPDQLGNIARAVELFGREMNARRLATEQLELAQRELEARIEERTRALSESEARFRHLFDHSPLPMWVYSTRTLRFLEVNDAALSKYGYTRQEFLSMSLMDIRPADEAERLRRWLPTAQGALHHGLHWRHRARDGHVFDVEIFLSDTELGGEPARLAVAIDITARKDAERLAQRFFAISRDVIIVTDRTGRFLQVSPSAAAVLGYQPEELLGHTGDRFILPADLELVRRQMRAARKGLAATRPFKCRYVHKDGHVVPLVWTSTWSEPDAQHFFMGRDMSEYERTEEQLRQAQKMEAVGQLTGGVAHDFNNILMVIMANVEALEEEQEGLDEYLRGRIRGIGKATKRASDLTRQLLAFSRKQPLRPQLMNVNHLVVDTEKLLKRTLGEQIEIHSSLGDDLWSVEVDAAQLEAALVNLSINARDAMAEGGRLVIETRNVSLDESASGDPEPAVGDYVMLAVSDTGAGMPPDVLARVFEPFFTTKGAGKGTGLGLSMVYGFIKQSRGHVRIYSEVGNGTTIRMYLPRSTRTFEGTVDVQREPMPRGTETILVVEDSEQVRDSVVAQLVSLGYTIVEASDGPSAIAACEAAPRPFDLLLTDVIMPGDMNGPGLVDEVTRRWPSTKVVFMSGYTENAMGRQGQLERDVLLISKPFPKRDLAQIVRRALERDPTDRAGGRQAL